MKAVEKLEGFLHTEYIHNEEMDSPDMGSAIRDILTDLLHLGDTHGICIHTRLADAQEVYEVEANTELQDKTGVKD